jgi:hypothetical protein
VKPRGGCPYSLLYPVLELPHLLLLLLLILEFPLVLEDSHGVLIIGPGIRPTLHGVTELPQCVIGETPRVPGGRRINTPTTVSSINLSNELI